MFQVENYQEKKKEKKVNLQTNWKPIHVVGLYHNSKASLWTLFPVKLVEII